MFSARKEHAMGYSKSTIGPADRRRMAGQKQYDVAYFAQKHRISNADARAILQDAGGSRDKANELAALEKRPR